MVLRSLGVPIPKAFLIPKRWKYRKSLSLNQPNTTNARSATSTKANRVEINIQTIRDEKSVSHKKVRYVIRLLLTDAGFISVLILEADAFKVGSEKEGL